MGVKPREGKLANLPASLLLPQGRKGPAFLAYPNYKVLFDWNKSFVYVTTAAYFATRIQGADPYVAGKPDPAPFVEAARRVGLPPSTAVVIEDTSWGLTSARGAGCATIAVTHTYPRAALNADIVVDSLDEVDDAMLRRALERKS